MDEERAKYLKIYQDYFNTSMKCPYCDELGDPHRDECFLLDIIAYIEEGVPLPAQQPAAPAQPAAEGGADAPRELPYERFMEILHKELHFPGDEDMFDEWAIIEAIRQDNAALMTRDAEVERLQAELADARARAAALERALEAEKARVAGLADALIVQDRRHEERDSSERRKMESKLNELLKELNSPELLNGPLIEHNLNAMLIMIRQRKARERR